MRFQTAIRCGIEHGGVNDTNSRYASPAYYYVRDRRGLAQTDAVEFSGPGVETRENYFEGDDDDVLMKCAILKTKDPVKPVLKIDLGNSGVRLRRVLDQSMGPQRAEVSVDGAPTGAWSIGELRALSQVERPLGEAAAEAKPGGSQFDSADAGGRAPCQPCLHWAVNFSTSSA